MSDKLPDSWTMKQVRDDDDDDAVEIRRDVVADVVVDSDSIVVGGVGVEIRRSRIQQPKKRPEMVKRLNVVAVAGGLVTSMMTTYYVVQLTSH